jgi:hypothetical protein
LLVLLFFIKERKNCDGSVVEGKFVPFLNIEGYRLCRDAAFLNWAPDGDERSRLHPCRFTPGKEQRYLLNRRIGGPQGQPGLFGKEEYVFC